jgi:hypothetical protein
MTGLGISFQWRTAVVQEGGDAYYFPDKFTSYFREKYSTPVIYRWRVLKNQPGEKECVYIGEAEELPRRIQRVRTPSKTAKDTDTNKRLHQIFHDLLSQGRKIVIDVGDIDPFEVNGVRFGRQAIDDRFKRRALENIVLALAQESGEFQLLNVVVDPVEETRQKLLKLPPHKLRELMKIYGLEEPG